MVSCYLMRIESVFQGKNVLGLGCTKMYIYLTLLNSTLRNGCDGKFHVICFLPQLKRKK